MFWKSAKLFTKTLILGIYCFLALTVTASADALLQVASDTVNFGQVKQGEIVSGKFQVSNTGTEPVTIQFMEFSMPGLRASVQPKINAGSTNEILVSWDTSQLEGEVNGKVILTLDDLLNPEIVLVVTGTVAAP